MDLFDVCGGWEVESTRVDMHFKNGCDIPNSPQDETLA